jgi:hypothetical protein
MGVLRSQRLSQEWKTTLALLHELASPALLLVLLKQAYARWKAEGHNPEGDPLSVTHLSSL